jgi:hypothetical protein
MEDIMELFYTPLSTQTNQELIDLQGLMQDNPLSAEKDRWQYSWGILTQLKLFMIRPMPTLGGGVSGGNM